MKRFGKILVVALALCLLVGALALAISANTDPAISGKYVVKGVGYNDWSEAVSAAGNGGTVYVNEDISIDNTITVADGTSLTVNLNGHTVAVNADVAFSVTNGTLTLAGNGTVNNVSIFATAIGANANLVLDATGSGVVINHAAGLATVQTVRAYDSAAVTVKGALDINKTDGAKKIFDVSQEGSTLGAVSIDFVGADVSVVGDSGTHNSEMLICVDVPTKVTIKDSKLEITGGVISSLDRGSEVSVSGLYSGGAWSDSADYSGFVFPESYVEFDVDGSTLISRDNGTSKLYGSIIYAQSTPVKASFDDSVLFGDGMMFSGYNNPGSKLDLNMFTFNNCDIAFSGTNTASAMVFVYGINFVLEDCSVSYPGALTTTSSVYPYKEIREGFFVGGKVDNLLVGGTLASKALGVDVTGIPKRGENVSKNICGTKFTYNWSYSTKGVTHLIDDGNVPGSTFYTATTPFDGADEVLSFTSYDVRGKSGAGEIKTVYEASGNGYIKYSYSGTATTNADLYDQVSGVSGNVDQYDFMVIEFDVATDSKFTYTNFTVAGRTYLTQYKADGTVLETGAAGYQTKPVPPAFRVNGADAYIANVSGVKTTIATDGSWSRITIIVETNISDPIQAAVPTYSAVDTKDGGKYVTTVRDYSETKLHYYVNGTLLYTYNWGEAMGYTGYLYNETTGEYDIEKKGLVIDDDTCSDIVYLAGLWIQPTAYTGATSSIAVDNIRYSKYAAGTVTDSLGLYTDETLKTSIVGNSNFLVMPDNNALATVNGTPVYSEAALASAITEGAKVELKKNLSNILNIDKACTIDTNGLSVAGFASATHKAVNYNGVYHFTAASASEIYTVNYSFNGVNKTVKAALGTTVNHPGSGDFGGLAVIDGKYYNVTGCQLIEGSDVSVVSDYYLTSNTVNAVVLTEELDPTFLAGNGAYETLADAVANANGAEIKLLKDITLSALDGVTATTYKGTTGTALGVALNITDGSTVRLNLNGKTITQDFDGTLFNVTNGTLELIGEAKFASLRTLVRATGENSNIIIKAYGKGFDADAAAGSFTFVLAEQKANLTVTGNIVYTPSEEMNTQVFKVNTANNIVFDRANVLSEGAVAATNVYNKFMVCGNGGNITVNNSTLTVIQGSMFLPSGGATATPSYKDYMATDANGGYLFYPDSTKLVNGKVPISIADATLTITANNSNITASLGAVADANQGGAGAIIATGSAAVRAEFNNCNFVGNNRVFTGTSAYRPSKYTALSHQLVFNDCNFTYDGYGSGDSGFSPSLFFDNVNFNWNGGHINTTATSNIARCCIGYFEVNNGFVGTKMTNVYFSGRSDNKYNVYSPTTQTAAGGDWVDYVLLPGSSTAANIIEDGELVTYAVAYLDAATKAANSAAVSGVKYSSSMNFDSTDWTSENGTTTGTRLSKGWSPSNAKAEGFRISEISTANDGNGYVKFEWNPNTAATGYFYIAANGADCSNATDSNGDGILNDEASKKVSAGNLVDANNKYQVVEYDLRTDSQLPDLIASFQRRALANLKYDAQGNLTQANRSATNFGPNQNINFYSSGNNSFLGEAFTMKLEPHSWYRITIVLEVSYKESTKEVVTGVSVPSYDFSDTKAHLYINGELMVSAPLFGSAAEANIDQRVAKSNTWTELRFVSTANRSTLSADVELDNVRVAMYAADPGVYGADSKLLTTLTENDKLLSMPYNNIAVDGIGYANAEAAAAAIKTGSLVELRSDVNAPIAISGAKSVTVKTNGYNFAGFVSADTKVLDYSASGYYYTEKALEGEIYTLVYGTVGGVTNESTTAAAGTVIAPTNAITAAPEFAPETEQYKNYLGWSFYENKVVTTVPYVNGKTTLNVVGAYEMVDAVKVIYKNGDAVLDTEYYFPGASDKLNEYNGPAIATDDTPVWYSVGFVYWDEGELDLSTPGTYEVNAFIGKLNPDANTAKEVGMQFNLTLYNNSELNVYIPVVDTITDLEVYVVTDSGEYLIDYITKGTIKGEEYYKYSYTLGTADTRILDFKVSYKIGSAALSYTFEYGIPSYANAAMTQISDTDTNGVVAKALVMNMVNYANKVLAVMGETGDSVGAEIYENLIATYATEGGAGYNAAYLAAFNALEDSDFLAGGDIYVKDGVADINWNDPENAASQYIAGISFVFDTYEPCFVLKYSDAAIAKGIQRPDGSGSAGFFNGGVFAYAGYTGALNTVSVFPVAYDKDGNKLTRADAAWYSFDAATGAITNNTNAENSYFAYAKNAYANRDQGSRFSISNLLNGVSFSIYVGGEPVLATDPETGDLLVNADGENYYRSVPTNVGSVDYNLSAYINSLLTADNAADNADEIAAAKALYAFSQAAGEYVKK